MFDFKNGRGFQKDEWSTSGLPIIRIQNLNNPRAPYNYFDGQPSPDILVEPGDLLYSWSGTVGSSFGPHLWSGRTGVLNQHIFKVNIRGRVEKRYAFHALRYITEEIERSVNGAVGLVHITLAKLREFTIPVPPRREQQRIVGILDEAFACIAEVRRSTERNFRGAHAIFDSALESAFSRRDGDWADVTLESILADQPRNGWSPPATHHSASGTPVLTLSSVTGFRFRPDKVKHTSAPTDEQRSYWVANGDFLMTRSNTPDLVGHVAIAAGIDEPTIYPDLIMRMNPLPDRMMTEFLYYQMRSPSLRKVITSRAQGANPTMKKINNAAVRTLPVRVPPISTQRAIVTMLDALAAATDSLAGTYERKLASLDALTQSLLHQAFAGELGALAV